MGWHCVVVWECDLKADRREATLEELIATLNHIYFVDHNKAKRVIAEPDEEDDISAFAADDNCD